MMARKCMIKLMLVMMKSIILIILEVHANDPTFSLPLPLHYQPTFIHSNLIMRIRLISTVALKAHIESMEKNFMEYFIAIHLLECLFNDPMHPKDYPKDL
jgi:hypothetical protein